MALVTRHGINTSYETLKNHLCQSSTCKMVFRVWKIVNWFDFSFFFQQCRDWAKSIMQWSFVCLLQAAAIREFFIHAWLCECCRSTWQIIFFTLRKAVHTQFVVMHFSNFCTRAVKFGTNSLVTLTVNDEYPSKAMWAASLTFMLKFEFKKVLLYAIYFCWVH